MRQHRFGTALVSLGDLDLDGYDDFAVGSPFEDEGKGAVRIYYGKKDIESIAGKDVLMQVFALTLLVAR